MLLAAWLQKQAGVHLLSVRYAITLAVGYGIYLLVLRWWAARLLDDEGGARQRRYGRCPGCGGGRGRPGRSVPRSGGTCARPRCPA